MANAIGNGLVRCWQAELVTEYRCIPKHERTPSGNGVTKFYNIEVKHIAIFKPGYGRILFRVNQREDRPLSFTDTRERETGAAGTDGRWGTLPKQRQGRCRSLTPTAFVAEVSRLIGTEQALEIVQRVTE